MVDERSVQIVLTATEGPTDVSGVIRPRASKYDAIGSKTIFGLQSGSATQLGRSIDHGETFVAGELLSGGEICSAMTVVPVTGTVIVATRDGSASNNTAATISKLRRSTNNLGTTTVVCDLVATDGWSGYVTGFSMDAGLHAGAGIVLAGEYGYKVAPDGGNNAHRVVVSTDDGQSWFESLNLGDFNNQHVHACLVDSRGWLWVTTGDLGTGAPDALAIWRNKNGGNPADWESFHFTYAGRDFQALGIADGGDGFMYVGEDRNPWGVVARFDATNPAQGNFEVTFSPDLSETPTGRSQWSSAVYHLFRDSAHGVMWAYFTGEKDFNQGRFALSPHGGTNWVTVANLGNASPVTPNAGKFMNNASYVFYTNGWRFPLYQPQRLAGMAPTQVRTITRTVDNALTDSELLTIYPADLGMGFRLVGLSLFVKTPTNTVTLSATKSGASLLATAPVVSAGATGDARRSAAVIERGVGQNFGATDSPLVIGLTIAGGGAGGVQVMAHLEHPQQPVPVAIGA